MTFNRLALDIVQLCNKYVAEGGQVVAHTWRSRDGRCGCPLAVWSTGGVFPIPPPAPAGYLMGSEEVALERQWDSGLFPSCNEAEVFMGQFTQILDGAEDPLPYDKTGSRICLRLDSPLARGRTYEVMDRAYVECARDVLEGIA